MDRHIKNTGPFLGGVLTQLLPPTPELRCFNGGA